MLCVLVGEFEQRMKGGKVSPWPHVSFESIQGSSLLSSVDVAATPAAVNWTAKGVVTGVSHRPEHLVIPEDNCMVLSHAHRLKERSTTYLHDKHELRRNSVNPLSRINLYLRYMFVGEDMCLRCPSDG